MTRTSISLFAFALALQAQTAERTFYFPKPVRTAVYTAPMKPLTRLADLKAKHWGATNWSELVIDDGNSRGHVVSAAPGSKVVRRLFPDSPAWWVVQEGRIRFEIETSPGKFQTFDARKGSYVFVPERHLHAFEVIGTETAIRFEVTLGSATPVFEAKPQGTGASEIEFISVKLQTGTNLLDVPPEKGRPERFHVNIEDLESAHKGQMSWTEPAQRRNRVRGNFIYGHKQNNPKAAPGNRGHFHSDFAEFWIVLRGTLRWTLEGLPEPLLASEGDIVYAPPKTFHVPEFWGDGPSCRLTSSTYPNANHITDAK